MLIIIEGIDRVGKTTLANMLHKKINFPIYKHIGKRNLDAIDNEHETDEYLQMLEICRLSDSNIIFDRLHWTDFVYGSLQRHYDFTAALSNKDNVERLLLEQNAAIIFVKSVSVKDSSYRHGKDLSRHEKLFEFLYNESNLDKFQCDYKSLDKAVNWVFDKMQKRVDTV